MENHLVGVSGTVAGQAVSANLVYDVLGRLSQTTINGVTTQFHYDGTALLGEYEGGVLTRRYVHGDQVDEPLVQYSTSAVNSTARRFLHADHQGSLIAHSNSSGAAVQTNSYDSYGIPALTNDGRFGYTGQTWFKQLGLNYYKARIYSPKLGRFLQTDPIFYKDDLNLYGYVGNNPVNSSDPTGTQCSQPRPDANGQLITDKCFFNSEDDRNRFEEDYPGKADELLANMKEATNEALALGFSPGWVEVPKVNSRGTTSATYDAREVADNLVNRKLVYDPGEKDVLSTTPDGSTLTVGSNVGQLFGTSFLEALGNPSSLFRNHAQDQQMAFFHEGIHSPRLHAELGPRESWYNNHRIPFNQSVCRMIRCPK